MAVAIDAQGIQELFPEIAEIQDSRLKQGVIDIWLEVAAETAWSDFNEIPKNLGGEKHRSLVGHTRGVTKMALAMADIAADLHGMKCDRDMLLASCLLHDASKPLESEPNPEGTASGGPPLPGRKSEIGEKIQHGVYTAHKVLQMGLPLELAHLIITHTHGSNVRANSFEASLLFYADFADSDAGVLLKGGRTFANKIHFGE